MNSKENGLLLQHFSNIQKLKNMQTKSEILKKDEQQSNQVSIQTLQEQRRLPSILKTWDTNSLIQYCNSIPRIKSLAEVWNNPTPKISQLDEATCKEYLTGKI